MGGPHTIGIVGLGVISRAYLDTLAECRSVEVVAVADLDTAKAQNVADALPRATACSVEELMAEPGVDTVLNLTVPAAHAAIALAAIASGKHVYGEKPLTASLDKGRQVLEAARTAGTRVGCAPDTVLGTGIQTARRAVDEGVIGRPIAATATWVAPGHEAWHPAPDFYYRPGGGPLLDMGPYYLTALVHLLGPVEAVYGSARRSRTSRVIATGPRAGERVAVEVDTHVTGVLEHAGGAVSTVVVSFEGAGSAAPPLEVHGEKGSLALPDPNWFDGEVRLRGTGRDSWEPLAPSAGYENGSRGVGLVDFLDEGRARANGDVAMHVLEVMTRLLESAGSGQRLAIHSTIERPALVPLTPASQWRGSEFLA